MILLILSTDRASVVPNSFATKLDTNVGEEAVEGEEGEGVEGSTVGGAVVSVRAQVGVQSAELLPLPELQEEGRRRSRTTAATWHPNGLQRRQHAGGGREGRKLRKRALAR